MFSINDFNRNVALNHRNTRHRNAQTLPHAPTPPSVPSVPYNFPSMRDEIIYGIPSFVMRTFRGVLLGAIAAYVFFYIMVGSGKVYVRFIEMVVVLALCSQVARLVRWAIQFSVKHINNRMHHTSPSAHKHLQENNKSGVVNSVSDTSHKSKISKENFSLPSSPTLN